MAARARGKYVNELLHRVQENAVPSMVAVLFENQMAMARGMRCVLKVPVALVGPAEPTQWALVCPPMSPVDEAVQDANRAAARAGFVFYDGFDCYGTEQEARDTRFVEPGLTQPNPVFDPNYSAEAFEDREVFRANTIVSVAGSPSSRLTSAPTSQVSIRDDVHATTPRTPGPGIGRQPPTPLASPKHASCVSLTLNTGASAPALSGGSSAPAMLGGFSAPAPGGTAFSGPAALPASHVQSGSDAPAPLQLHAPALFPARS